ncbi:MAG: GNAT family N-acetyltransferase [Gammaproteobacteria bacterium]|nr:GNAT family N-acetyltransferase [Gammaproteobacteria bacterium]
MTDATEKCRLRRGGPGDAEALSSLAFRSKASWGYDIEFMKRCRAELTYDAAQIEAPRFRFVVAEIDGVLAAFYALEILGDHEAELDALFVRPDLLRQGLGTLLVDHMKSQARLLGITRVTIQGDPNAEDFYASIGATAAGYRESASIPGRYLPVFALVIGKGNV